MAVISNVFSKRKTETAYNSEYEIPPSAPSKLPLVASSRLVLYIKKDTLKSQTKRKTIITSQKVCYEK